MKRILALLLALALCLTFIPTTFALGFPFKDVPTGEWYYNDVKTAYENGLINGKGDGTVFQPNANMTYAEAVKLAACMYQRYTTGAVSLANGSPNWYDSYVDYAKVNGIISKDYSWNQAATRAGYMEIFANALPDEALAPMNYVEDGGIPDVPMTHAQADAIYKLYRAGILQGSGGFKCNPGDSIIRSEVAAILTRMMDSDRRVSFTIGEKPAGGSTQALTITQSTSGSGQISSDGTVTASVGVTGGDGKYTYKWEYKVGDGEWKTIAGAETALLSHKPAAKDLKLGTVYRCIISDGAGASVTTRSLTARKPADTSALAIVSQPENVSAKVGDTVSFSVEVSGGKPPYDYLWMCSPNANLSEAKYLNVMDGFSGGTTATAIGKATTNNLNKKLYIWCNIADATGKSIDTEIVELTEQIDLLVVTGHPADAAASAGDTVSFTVAVSGGKEPYTYQWMYSPNANLSGSKYLNYKSGFKDGTKATATGKVTAEDLLNGFYVYCIVSDASGQMRQSGVATLIQGNIPLTITTQPQDVSCKVGDTAVFSVEVKGGTEPYSYWWQFKRGDGDYINMMAHNSIASGMRTAQVSMPVNSLYASSDDITVYRCVITDAEGNSVTTRNVSVKLVDTPAPLTITTQPQSVIAAVGDTATYTVKVSGGRQPYTYTWQWSRTSGRGASYSDLGQYTFNYIEGLGTATLKIKNLSSDALSYNGSFRCIITDADGNHVTTNGAMLSRHPLTITTQPQSVNCYAGETVTFNVSVSGGTAPYTYKWRFRVNSTGDTYADVIDGKNTTGQWTPQITVKTNENHITSGTVFVCIVKDANGKTIESATARLNVSQPEKLTADIPQPGPVNYDRRQYTCNVSGGVGPYTYSWKNQNGKFLGSSSSCWTYKDDGTTKVICTVTDATGKSVTTFHAVYY